MQAQLDHGWRQRVVVCQFFDVFRVLSDAVV